MQTGNHLVCSRQYPRTACVLCAVQWVWSPSDNVPNREEAARRTPLRESRSVKGQGRAIGREYSKNRTRRQASYRPTGIKRSMMCFLVFAHMERLQVSNVPVRNP
jgi:hypothetical protein